MYTPVLAGRFVISDVFCQLRQKSRFIIGVRFRFENIPCERVYRWINLREKISRTRVVREDVLVWRRAETTFFAVISRKVLRFEYSKNRLTSSHNVENSTVTARPPLSFSKKYGPIIRRADIATLTLAASCRCSGRFPMFAFWIRITPTMAITRVVTRVRALSCHEKRLQFV